MAIATLTLRDTNTIDGSIDCIFNVEGEQIEEGNRVRYTAAHVAAFYLFSKFKSGELNDLMAAFADGHNATIHQARPSDASEIVLTFTDTDVKHGYYSLGLKKTRGEDAVNWTGALLAAHTIHDHIQTSAFKGEMWVYADKLASENEGASITNLGSIKDIVEA